MSSIMTQSSRKQSLLGRFALGDIVEYHDASKLEAPHYYAVIGQETAYGMYGFTWQYRLSDNAGNVVYSASEKELTLVQNVGLPGVNSPVDLLAKAIRAAVHALATPVPAPTNPFDIEAHSDNSEAEG